MSKPRWYHTVERIFNNHVHPGIYLAVTVPFASVLAGQEIAGWILVSSSILISYENSSKAKYWNTEYLITYIIGTFAVIVYVPNLFSPFVDSQLSGLSSLVLIFHLSHLFITLENRLSK